MKEKKMAKYVEPLYVYAWKLHPTMPRCCFLCQHFNEETAECKLFHQIVPEDFAGKEDACKSWIDKDGVPF